MIKWLKAAAVAALAVLSAWAALFIKSQRDRALKAEEEARIHRQAIVDITGAAMKAKQAAEDTAAAGEKANNERESLAATPDSGLLSRANKLFP
jgi:hypothetical protein